MDLTTIVATVTALGSAAAVFTRYLVSLLQLGTDTPPWLPGIVALGAGIGSAAALEVIQGVPPSPATYWTVVLAGIVAAAITLGLDAAQTGARRAKAARAVRRASLNRGARAGR